ncbi:MAG: hypothetical protein KF878_09295 [Planctomycetes bacterium]|nr:hypothetical protein [Planctomycetota bacterium]
MARPAHPSPLLVGLTAGVVLGVAVGVLRVQPGARALLYERGRVQDLTQAIAASPPPTNLTPLADEVDRARAARDDLQARVDALAARVAPDALVPDLEHRVAALARDAGLRLESQDAALARAAGPAAGAASPRARRWTFGGTFHGLWRFVVALEGLPHRVVLRDLRITTRPPAQSPALGRRAVDPPLVIQVTVVP